MALPRSACCALRVLVALILSGGVLTQESPTFDSDSYTATINQNLPNGTQLFSVGCTYSGSLQYEIIRFTPNVQFVSVGNTSGIVTLRTDAVSLAVGDYTASIQCFDPEDRSQRSLSIIVVSRINQNQYSPVWLHGDPLEVSVSEAHEMGVVVDLNATDNDLGSFGEIEYGFKGILPDSFSLNPTTGEVALVMSLDYDTVDTYQFIATASNPPESSSIELLVIVHVTDVNDEPPAFTESNYQHSVQETFLDGGIPRPSYGFFAATCTDVDSEDERITYQIVSGEDAGPFIVDSATGAFSATQDLDSDAGPSSYSFQVVCFDNGSPNLTSMLARVDIVILPVNEFVPEIVQAGMGFLVTTETQQSDEVLLSGPLEVVDNDGGPDGEVTYALNTAGTNGTDEGIILMFLDVNRLNGDLIARQDIDVDLLDADLPIRIFHLKITACDTDPPREVCPNFIRSLLVASENDNDPMFSQSDYDAMVPETVAVNTVILQASCTDRDRGTGAFSGISFSNPTQAVQSIFAVDSQTGDITVVSPLDYEQTTSYGFELRCEDNGGKRNNSLVRVNVVAVNDHNPQFVSPHFLFSVSETAPSDRYPIGSVQATDHDVGEGGELRYSFVSENTFFRITSTGFIQLFESLTNYSDSTVNLTVEVTDGYTTSEANVTIFITDGNYNQPTFASGGNVVTISELTPVGNTVLSVACTDSDSGSNKEITYSLEEGNAGEVFDIDPSQGSIVVASSLILPQNSTSMRYELLVRCSDGGTPVLSDETLVLVSVYQEDDSSAPSIANDTLQAFVSEDARINDTVITVRSESAESANLRYTIEEASMPNVFQIDPSRGRVFVVAALDRETISTYQMIVVVTEIRSLDDFRPVRSDNATLFIFLRDVNDNTPMCINPAGVTIDESLPLGSLVAQLNCSDDDTGMNGDIVYTLEDDFSVMAVTDQGQLILNNSLASTDSNILVVAVIVADRGSPSRTNTYHVTVFISSSNRFAPSFVNLPNTTLVPESQPTQSLIFTVESTDPDRGRFGQISYAIVNSKENDAFKIVPSSGMVLLDKQLSHHQQSLYILNISASDGGHVTVETLTINVLDENNFAPECDQPLDYYAIQENTEPPHLVGIFPCSDADEGPNGEIKISILSGDSGHAFDIQPNGSIIATQSLDFEQTNLYILLLQVEDLGSPPLSVSNTLVIFVIVNSVNEFAPSFEQEEYFAHVFEDASVGDTILNVTAADRDSSVNLDGIVAYNIVGNVTVPFTISESGMLLVGEDLDREAEGMYQFTIRAADQALVPLFDTATVTITVDDVDDNPPMFSAISYSAILNGSADAAGPILVLNCTDNDLGHNAALSYSLISSGDGMFFQVNSTTGGIYLTDDLPLSRTYTFEAMCTGLGPANFSDVAMVSIQVLVESNITFSPSSIYNVLVSEDTIPVSNLLQVNASSSSEAILSYALTSEGSPFDIDAESGILRLISSLDYESVRSYALQVQAFDSGTPPGSGTALINVDVGNVNDNAPQITNVSTVFFLSEEMIDMPVTIGEYQCSDADGGDFGKVVFRLGMSDLGSQFFISETGSLLLVAGLDYETAQTHSITLVCQDGGTPPLTDSTTVSIQVYPVNDNAPIFPPDQTPITVEESLEPGRPVGPPIQATDVDLPPHSELQYRIAGGDLNQTFFISPNSGQLILLNSLDYEAVQSYSLLIEADDGGALLDSEFEVLSSSTVVTIHIRDVNDNRPILSSPLYLGEIPDTSTTGEVVSLSPQISCTDVDSQENGEVSLHIVSGNTNNTFAIQQDGLVTVQGSLNFDTTRIYQMKVECRDNGEPQRMAEATLVVNVVGVSEFVPEFASPTYNFRVAENATIGTEIGVISVGDRDGQGGITYAFVNTTATVFVLDSNTGAIVVASSLDYETQEQLYVIGAMATDIAGYSGFATIIISILNIDDNLPLFASSSYYASVLEHVAVGHVVTRVICTDADDEADGRRVSYSIVATSPFRILDGAIVVGAPLDLEIEPRYRLDIACRDSNGNTARATLNIDLKPFNDFPPVFTNTHYAKQILENPPIGTTVVTVMATDDDVIKYNDITYVFVAGNGANRFALDAESGTVTVAGPLDREVQDQYVFTIQAINVIPPGDTSGSEALRDESMLTLTVIDVNDNDPLITTGQSSIFIPESNSTGVVVTNFACTDADTGSNGVTTFSLANSALLDQFKIFDNGSLVTTKSLTGNVVVEVVCADSGFPRRAAIATVTIYTVSMNNHAPAFEQSSYNVTINESQPVGVDIMCFAAIDMDGPNTVDGTVYYSLIPVEVPNGATGHFSIGRDTGCLFATQNPSSNERYAYNIIATDQGEEPLSGATFLIITVLDVFQDPPMFEGSPYTRTVSELSESGTFIASTLCQDPDADDSVTYLIAGGNDQGLFSIGELNGTIVLAPGNRLDYEMNIFHTLVVQCIDTANFTDEAMVLVTVTPVNEFTPSFQSLETVNVPEHSIRGTVASQLSWTDHDMGPDGDVTFMIISGSEGGEFTVTDDGRILVSGVLDREVHDSYRLEIEIQDLPIEVLEQRSSRNHIDIAITDINDHPPVFSDDPYLFGPFEGNEALGHYIGSVSCSDQDVGENAEVSYSISAGSNELALFSIDSRSGNITLSNYLDLRSLDTIGFIIECVDTASRQMTGTSQVIVTVEEFNGFPPEFANSSYSVRVAENVSIGNIVLTIIADDRDSGIGGRISYSLSGSTDLPFRINEELGDIYPVITLDFESDTDYDFVVVAMDGAADSVIRHTASVNVTIEIVGVNEYAPYCTRTNLYVVINASTQGEVISIDCYDEDSGLDGMLVYSLSNDSVTNELFEISAEGNVIVPTPIVAVEGVEQYNLEVIVSDSGTSSKQAQVCVILVYSYENLHAPAFDETEYFLSVSELEPVGHRVATLTATDLDISLQGQLHYSLSESHYFQVEPSSGTLFVSRPLDYEAFQSIQFMLLAEDSDPYSPQNGSAVVSIAIANADDNAPVCNQSTYTFETSSSAAVDDNVSSISCFDPDGGNLQYEIASSDFFGIRPTTGQIYVTQQLLTTATDILDILISDGVGHRIKVWVIMVIRFVNTQEPIFPDKYYYFSTDEDANILTYVGSVAASDNDSSSLSYSILNSEQFPQFYLHPQNGQLFLTGVLDFEYQQQYNFTVSVEDGGSFDGSDSLFDVASVTIHVQNTNDNHPELSGVGVYGTTVPQSTALHTSILSFSCTDGDAGPYGEPTITSLGFEGTPLTLDVLDNQGRVMVSGTLSARDYLFTVVCTDGGGLSVDGEVHVFVPENGAPSFNQPMYHWVLKESSPTGSEYTAIQAESTDDSIITFSLTAGSDNATFYIHPNTGVVKLVRALDYEVKQAHAVVVTATDSASRQARILLLVEVIDESDEEPFIPSSLLFSVPHNAPVGYPIGTLQCGHGTSNGDIMFTLSTSLFSIDSLGTIRLEGVLRATTSVYVIPYSCSDEGTLTMSGTVTIEVLFSNQFDPIFSQAAYTFFVPESTEILFSIGTVHASDSDSGSFGEVTYLLGDDVSDQFFIDGTTGDIRVLSQLDREREDSHTLSVLALDGGSTAVESSRRSTEVTVMIIIQDVNDNPPVPNPAIYVRRISTSHRFLNPVLSVQFSDLDLSHAGLLSYSLSPSTEQFAIQANGTIVLTREQHDEAIYHFNVIATDGGIPALSASAIVTVIVDLSEPAAPVFASSQYAVSVHEGTPVGSVVLQVNATAGDGTVVVYNIEEGNVGGKFSLNPHSGELILSDSVDADMQQWYVLSIHASSTGRTSLTSVGVVAVEIVRISMTAPAFGSPFYMATISERAILLSPVVQTRCVNVGSNVTYEIASVQDGFPVFSILNNGLVIVASELDFETVPIYTLRVTCSDGYYPPATAIITIQVSPVNEYLPVFSQLRYQFSIEENNFGTSLGSIEATDLDAGSQGEVTYHLQDPGNYSIIFVEPFSGEVVVTNILDYEVRRHWNLTVIARDGAGAESHAFIAIDVTNVNDMKPVIEPITAIGTVLVDSPPDYPVQSYLCSDADGSATQLSIENGNGLNYFALNSYSQLVWTGVGGDLTSDAVVSLTLQCQERVDVTQLTMAYVAITIRTNITDFPEFSESSFNGVVIENAPTGTSIISVTTTGGGQVVYDLFNLPPNFPFSINETNGMIFVTGPLDHERVSLFVFTVRAAGVRSGAISLASVHIIVEDVNDNSPIIDSPLHPVTLHEDLALFVPFYGVHCSDMDSGSNGEVSIEVVAGNHNRTFGVTSIGSLYLNSHLDFELAENHTLTITCYDSGTVPRSTTTTLLIIVAGVNEFAPVFVNESYEFTVLEYTPAGTSIGTLSATDDDRGVGEDLIYTLIGGNGGSFVAVTSSGDIYTALQPLDATLHREINILVRVLDSGSLSDEVAITISVEDVNEPPNFVTPNGPLAIIPMDHFLRTSIFDFSCADGDTIPNAVLTLSIQGNPSDLDVYLEETMGVSNLTSSIAINSSLFVGAYQLTLRCSDSGSPVLSTEINVTVRVEGANTPPQFLHGTLSRSVREDAQRGAHIVTVNATDVESIVTYSITGGSGLGVFSIDQFSGTITLSGPLDFELIDSYDLIITAYDEFRFDPKSASVQVFIFVFNTNDLNPVLIPPGFLQISIREDEVPPYDCITYSCSDPDGGVVSYSIYPPYGPLSPFDISSSGIIQLLGNVDYEIQRSHALTILCIDQPVGSADMARTVTATLVIDITAVNSFGPVYISPTDFQVPEDSTLGSVVAQVEAFDPDQRGFVTYTTDSHMDVFLLDPFSGNITLRQGLDYEMIKTYTLEVTVSDNDPVQPPRATTFPITINITDVNDNKPECSSHLLTENLIIGTYEYIFLATLSCTDQDDGPNAQLTYLFSGFTSPSILSGEFILDNRTGELGFSGTLSIAESLILDIVVSDNGVKPMSAQVTVTIQVVSDVGPRFEPNEFNVTLSESAPSQFLVLNGSVIREALANNAGVDAAYTLRSSESSVIFRIDFATADIILVSSTMLDYDEGVREYLLIVEAVVSSDVATATVHIVLSDYNDNAPQIAEAVYSATILENEPIGTSVLTVQATDVDSGVNGQFVFSVERSSEFVIDSISGEITSLRTFDREVLPVYSFTVLATDMGSPVRSGSALVNIMIGDVNDVPPRFVSSIHVININNLSPPGAELATLQVSDSDVTGSLTFQIITDETQVRETFIVDSPDGTLRQRTTTIPSDHPFQYNFTVEVSDGVASDTTSVVIYVLSVTMASAFFEENTDGENFNVREFLLLQNIDIAGNTAYTITSGNEENMFAINSTGALFTTHELDREITSVYEVAVKVVHGSDDEIINVIVVIQVIDQNDNAPIFLGDPYSFAVLEGTYRNAKLIGTLNATDIDEPNSANSLVQYYLLNAPDIFSVNQLSGDIYVQGLIDRETQETYFIRVGVHDYGGPPMFSYTTMNITVHNVNDNDPTFVPLGVMHFFVQIADLSAQVETELTRIFAVLPDGVTLPYTEFHYVDHDGDIITSTLITLQGSSKYELVNASSDGVQLRNAQRLKIIVPLDKRDNGTILQIVLSDEANETNPVARNVTIVITDGTGSTIPTDPNIITPSTGEAVPTEHNFFETDLGIAVLVVVCVLIAALLFFLLCLCCYCFLLFHRENDPKRQRPFTVAQRIQTGTVERKRKVGRPWEYYSFAEIDHIDNSEEDEPDSQYPYRAGLEHESSFMGVDYSPDLGYGGDPYAQTSPSTGTSLLSAHSHSLKDQWHADDLEAGPSQIDSRKRAHAMGGVMGQWDRGDKMLLLNEPQGD